MCLLTYTCTRSGIDCVYISISITCVYMYRYVCMYLVVGEKHHVVALPDVVHDLLHVVLAQHAVV